VPVGHVKFDMNRCNELPLRGEKTDFWPVSKFNTGILPLRSSPAGSNHILGAVRSSDPILRRCVKVDDTSANINVNKKLS